MTPSEIARRLNALNTDAELSGEHETAATLAQASAYLREYGDVVDKLDTCGLLVNVIRARYAACRAALDRAEARALALEAELLYLRARRNGHQPGADRGI